MGIMNIKDIKGGYLVVYILLLGTLFLTHVSPNKNLNWIPDIEHLSPGPVMFVSPSKDSVTDCGNVSTDDCLKKLQTFLRLKSLPFPTEEPKLNKLCSNTVAGYNCSARKLAGPNCLSSKDRDTIPVFIEMAQYTMFMFCSSGDGEHGYLRDDLLRHSECILKQKNRLDCCAEKSNLMDLPVMHFLDQSSRSLAERQAAACCPVANYIKCVQAVILESCGAVAGNLTTEYIRRSSGEQMDSVCQKLLGYPEPNAEICKSPPPVCPPGSPGSSGSSGSRIEIILGLTFFMLLLYVAFMKPV